jgi:hypothetical protein
MSRLVVCSTDTLSGFFDGDEGPTQEVDLFEVEKRENDYKPLNYPASICPDNLSA